MDILAPLSRPREVEPLHDAGATELYCGLMRSETLSKYSNVFSLNSRHLREANLRGFDELRTVVAKAHSLNMRVFVAYNAFYTEEQFDDAVSEAAAALEIGADGLIVADVSLILQLRENHPRAQLILSALGAAFNASTARLYKSLGVRRVTFPRHLTIPEMASIASAVPDMEFEAFIMSERCYFPNAFCHFEHAVSRATSPMSVAGPALTRFMDIRGGPIIDAVQDAMVARRGMMCCREYEASEINRDDAGNDGTKPFRFDDTWTRFRDACGLCSVYDLASIPNMRALKIVGRQGSNKRKALDATLVRKAVDALNSCDDKTTFVKAMKSLRLKHFRGACDPSYCYYNDFTDTDDGAPSPT